MFYQVILPSDFEAVLTTVKGISNELVSITRNRNMGKAAKGKGK